MFIEDLFFFWGSQFRSRENVNYYNLGVIVIISQFVGILVVGGEEENMSRKELGGCGKKQDLDLGLGIEKEFVRYEIERGGFLDRI